MKNLEHIKIKVANFKDSHKWQDVKNYIISRVSAGDYTPGDVLPSENYLCEKINVSRSTIRQAFKKLEDDGMIYRVKGKGTFLSKPNSSQNHTRLEMFGLIMPDARRSLYASLTQGFDDRLSSENFQTMICQTGNNTDKQGNLILRLLHKGIDGLAIVPVTSGDTPAYQIQTLIDNDIPVVLCHREVKGITVPTLCWDRREVGRLAGKIFIEHGHKKIAYFGVYKYGVTEEQLKGIKEMMEQAGLELPDSRIAFGLANGHSDIDVEAEREKVLEDMLLRTRPTAIFCNDDEEAERLYWLATRFSIKVPDELSIIGFGNLHRHSSTKQFISSIVIDEYELGKEAANLLCQIKNHKISNKEQVKENVKLDFYYGSSIKKM
ncbi:MAG: GntR family transcriptional regulator [Phycisphaerales bacterium]